MKNTHALLTVCALLTAALALPLTAQVPGAIHFQGTLRNASGNPVTTEVTVVFSFWDAASGGSQLGGGWSDADTLTPDDAGYYATDIGDDPGSPVPAVIFTESAVWLGVSVNGEEQLPRARLLAVPYAIESEWAQALTGGRFVMVQTSDDAAANGAALLSAYATAKSMAPTSSTRVTVIVPPAQYDLGTGALTLDTDFIDIAGLTTNRTNQYIYGTSNGSNSGVLMQTAGNVRIDNLYVKCTRSSGGVTFFSSDPAAYWPNVTWDTNRTGSPPETVIRNCEFDCSTTAHSWSMRLSSEYAGSYEDCTGGYYAFGGRYGDATGSFTNCTGGYYAFGSYNGEASGTFTNCTGGSYAFGGYDGAASGTFTDCTGGSYAFGGYNGLASGTFTNCTGGGGAFGGGSVFSDGGTASGTFTHCTGGNNAFGGGWSGSTSGGQFYYCAGGSMAFGSAAGGTFLYCVLNGAAFP